MKTVPARCGVPCPRRLMIFGWRTRSRATAHAGNFDQRALEIRVQVSCRKRSEPNENALAATSAQQAIMSDESRHSCRRPSSVRSVSFIQPAIFREFPIRLCRETALHLIENSMGKFAIRKGYERPSPAPAAARREWSLAHRPILQGALLCEKKTRCTQTRLDCRFTKITASHLFHARKDFCIESQGSQGRRIARAERGTVS